MRPDHRRQPPEVANTYTIGLTLTPTMLPGFTGSVDFFNIDLKNQINTVPGAYLFNQCLATGDPTFCGQVVRNHVNGALTGATVAGGGYIVQTSQNIAEVIFRGIDVQASYRYTLPAGWGTLSSTFNGSYLLKSLTTPAPGQHTFDCSGLVYWAFKRLGITMPRSSSQQALVGKPVSKSDLRPGDLIFFYHPVSHVGFYAGDGKVLNAVQTGDVVRYTELSRMKSYAGARRM